MTSANKANVLKNAKSSLSRVRQIIVNRILPELKIDDFVRFHRAYSPGMQEYIEARTFLSYCESDVHIATPEEVNAEVHLDFAKTRESSSDDHPQPHQTFDIIGVTDYVLGIADLTGEMMRQAIATKSQPVAVTILNRLTEIEHGMSGLADSKVCISKDFSQKTKVLRNSVAKVQKSCFDRVVQLAERIDSGSDADNRIDSTDDMDTDERQRKKLKSSDEPLAPSV